MIKIKVVGIGGSGGNTISRMKKLKIKGVELIAINTDYQDLKRTKADLKLQIGKKTTQGLGTGMRPKIGEKAARESEKEISQILKGGEMVFLTYGGGGGTGSGAGPVVAEIAKDLGILTVAIVTKPFSFEGQSRRKIANLGIEKLREKVDSLIFIENDKLLEILNPETSLLEAFFFCDQILREAVKAISDLILLPGLIPINFADIREILKNSGRALFGIGKASGKERTKMATHLALNSPLLDLSPKGARGLLLSVSGKDLSLAEVEEISQMVKKEINPQAKIIFGSVEDKNLKAGEIKLTLIATGF